MKKLAFLLCFAFSSFISVAGSNDPIGGARALSLGGASLGLQDHWSVFHNQAGLAHVPHLSAGVYYQNNFLISQLSTRGGVFVLPVGEGVFGVAIRDFGYSQFRQGSYGLAYGRKLSERFSAGVQLNYFNTFIGEGYGSSSALVAEIGFQYQASEAILLSGHLYNPSRSNLADFNDERIPTVLRAGINYIFSERAFLAAEIRKDIDQPLSVRAGAEYRLVERLYLRAGAGTEPTQTAFGLGVLLEDFQVDFAASYHNVLGFIPQLSISYHAR